MARPDEDLSVVYTMGHRAGRSCCLESREWTEWMALSSVATLPRDWPVEDKRVEDSEDMRRKMEPRVIAACEVEAAAAGGQDAALTIDSVAVVVFAAAEPRWCYSRR